MTSMDGTIFINCRQCIDGKLISSPLTIDSNGIIATNTSPPLDCKIVDLKNSIIAPGFIELQINGALGFHFAHYDDATSYRKNVKKLANYLPSTGVTGFYPTVPTVAPEVFKCVLPLLRPDISPGVASVLGAHVEGPFLAPSKKGAHDAANMHVPSSSSLEEVYGETNLSSSIKIVTLAPELSGAPGSIRDLTKDFDIRVSMGHSAATFEQGLAGMKAGASMLTHTFNAMNPLHHREPGLAGLISHPSPPYFSLIADAIHLHPRVVALAYRSAPAHCILITDSIELSGLPDGVHPGHAQIPFNQVKAGNKVTIENTDTLIGTCIGLDECVKNLMAWAEIRIEEAVRCVTENPASVMRLKDRGRLEVGRRGDFVVFREDGVVKETYILGERVYASQS
ncbi:carbohydrate esterase family 9 protein [Bisporella sp. PMI_857]|nr:carbohydrate esterase family 9 protein [Bisporella sp. PMI_857]